jgi:hypothetical protein
MLSILAFSMMRTNISLGRRKMLMTVLELGRASEIRSLNDWEIWSPSIAG